MLDMVSVVHQISLVPHGSFEVVFLKSAPASNTYRERRDYFRSKEIQYEDGKSSSFPGIDWTVTNRLSGTRRSIYSIW